MKALVLNEHGDNEKFIFDENFPDPVAEENDVVISVKAASLNYHDIFTRRGMPGINLPFPVIIGLDVAGEILSVGSNVTDWKVSDRVVVDPINHLSGVPSEKVTPGRILKVYTVLSALLLQLSAIQGSTRSVCGFCQVSLSVI